MLRRALRQGVTEDTTQLVVSDGAQGLASALDHQLYGVPHQRCIFHKIKTWRSSPVSRPAPGPRQPPAAALRQAKQPVSTPSWPMPVGSIPPTGKPRSCPAAAFRATGSTGAHSGGQLLHRLRPNLRYLDVDIPRVRLADPHHESARAVPQGVRRKQRDIGMFQSERAATRSGI